MSDHFIAGGLTLRTGGAEKNIDSRRFVFPEPFGPKKTAPCEGKSREAVLKFRKFSMANRERYIARPLMIV